MRKIFNSNQLFIGLITSRADPDLMRHAVRAVRLRFGDTIIDTLLTNIVDPTYRRIKYG